MYFSQFLTCLYNRSSSTDTEFMSVFEYLTDSIDKDIDELNSELEGLINSE